MIFKQETRMIKPSTDDEALQETLITEGTMDEEANMTRAKVKMEEVREENERLKLTLSQMMKDYHSLKMQFNGITQEDQPKKLTNLSSMAASDEESELVSLSLGRFSADHSKREEIIKKNDNSYKDQLDGLNWKLNLDSCMNLRPNESSLDESKEEGSPPKNSRAGDEDILQQNPLKKPRVSVRAVCNTQTMHDGCQWRKYGQKIAKGNPCPRAYYRCTVSSSCPVRKQVQRCIDDMSILVTTYEGTHNHPLPPSATAMASATSAAVAMLSCGSSTTSPPRQGVSAAPSTSPNLFGFNFTSSSTNSCPRATISTSQSHPTIILDLTAPNHSDRFSSNPFSAAHSTPASLSFSSFDPRIGWETRFPTINSVAYNPHPPLFPNIQKQASNDQKIAAATKVITHDPAFQSALAAAITSFIGNSNASSGMNFHLNFAQTSSTIANASVGCAATFMNRFPQPLNSQQKSLTHFAPLTFSASKSQPLSLADEGEQMKHEL